MELQSLNSSSSNKRPKKENNGYENTPHVYDRVKNPRRADNIFYASVEDSDTGTVGEEVIARIERKSRTRCRRILRVSLHFFVILNLAVFYVAGAILCPKIIEALNVVKEFALKQVELNSKNEATMLKMKAEIGELQKKAMLLERALVSYNVTPLPQNTRQSQIAPAQAIGRATVGSYYKFEWNYHLHPRDKPNFREIMFGLWAAGYTNWYFMTIKRSGEIVPNPQMIERHPEFIGRVFWVGNIMQSYAAFLLTDIRMSDNQTYGCTLDIGGFGSTIDSKITLLVEGGSGQNYTQPIVKDDYTRGPRGPPGIPGKDGVDGARGPAGKDGNCSLVAKKCDFWSKCKEHTESNTISGRNAGLLTVSVRIAQNEVFIVGGCSSLNCNSSWLQNIKRRGVNVFTCNCEGKKICKAMKKLFATFISGSARIEKKKCNKVIK